MAVKETIENAVSQATSFFEKATEMRVALHFLCVGIYAAIALHILTKKPLFQITLTEIEQIEPVKLMLAALGYFILLGYIFRIPYAIVSMALRWLSMKLSVEKISWRDIPGMVHERDVQQHAFDTKDNEPLRALEAHKEACRKNRKEMNELAYLSFVTLILGIFSYYFVSGDLFVSLRQWLSSLIGERTTVALSLLLLFPPLFFIWIDATDNFEREEYLKHGPLYAKIKEEQQKKTPRY